RARGAALAPGRLAWLGHRLRLCAAGELDAPAPPDSCSSPIHSSPEARGWEGPGPLALAVRPVFVSRDVLRGFAFCLLRRGRLGPRTVVLGPRVLRPPGGGSNFSLGFDEPTEQPVRRNKMASSIFGTPEENPPSWAKSAGAKSSGGREDSESSGPQRRNSSEANSGDFLDLKGEGDVHENMDTDLQATLGQSEEKPVPAAPVPSPVAPAPVPSRRNPPGGKSSLVLG
uniref:Jupiter microtubule associated homolog 1 n=1 Tax=Ovis aries TaxID=9940 RepID=A0AC11DJH3_SHEEP